MDDTSGSTHAQAFFLRAGAGQRYCLLHEPQQAPRGAVLYVHPFAEEMNKSRRMAALQARALAGAGFLTLQIDLFGCGDSSGELADASWERWLEDLALAIDWLRARSGFPPALLGLRLGGLLAVDCACHGAPVSGIALWSPVTDGAAHMRRFLRLRHAAGIVAGGMAHPAPLPPAPAPATTIEVAGYDLTPALFAAIGGRSLATLLPPPVPVTWIDIGEVSTAASESTVRRWHNQERDVVFLRIPGPAFWSSQEIEICPALLGATTQAIAGPVYVCE